MTYLIFVLFCSAVSKRQCFASPSSLVDLSRRAFSPQVPHSAPDTPQLSPERTEHLDLSHNDLRSLPSSLLASFRNLKALRQRPHTKALADVCIPYHGETRKASDLSQKAHFSRLYPGSKPLSHDHRVMAMGKHGDEDRLPISRA
ncbi:unnamed protein product [Soboliphyme baturini]|uniref:Leucine Rich repeat-containing domain protein n=1 Tax=Soboliphyme baturini TaxID=241478 RepID=A0A183INI3_9BILA|nr:unnamed protein product [Soboliphyme baturini]